MVIPDQILDAILERLQEKWNIEISIREHPYNKNISVIHYNNEEICEIYQYNKDGVLTLVIQYEIDDSTDNESRTKFKEWTYEYCNPDSFDLEKIVNQVYSIIMLHRDLMEDLKETQI